jgi:hypothetical protein
MIFRVWIPGRFSLTNKMLSNLRASEKFRGKKPRGWVDGFAQETAAIRMAAKRAILNREPTSQEWGAVLRTEVCALEFGVFGHRRHDPDAWYLLGKAVVDGFVDAGVISPDRASVWETGGRVLQSAAEECWWLCEHESGEVRVPSGPGVMVLLSFFERPVPRG